MRRRRKTETIRRLFRETRLAPDDLIAPLFVVHGREIKKGIPSLNGSYHLGVTNLAKEAKELFQLGIPAILLFGLPKAKDDNASEAFDPNGIAAQGIRAIKEAVPEVIVIADVCLCEYTPHGHCGILDNQGYLLNDPTLDLLGKAALCYARAGADIVAPAAMIDGQVRKIRGALDGEGYENVMIMSYAAKFASNLYEPFFKNGTQSSLKFGDKKTHQMDVGNSEEALREVALDLREGADIVIVKPAMSYLDIVCKVKEKYAAPVAAYNVSGEFAMIQAASDRGFIDKEKVMFEVLASIKRAGADMIITYFAKEAAQILNNGVS
jgi:porphobilinogen synthase